jgi:O-antigen/teichoic acid export membrane protein
MLNKVLSGTIWGSLNTVVKGALQLIAQLILARILAPEDFGLIGMALVFSTIITSLGELGIASILIQKKDKNLSELHFHTAFWGSIAFNIALYLFVLTLIAPLAAWFYDVEIISGLLIVISLQFLFQSCTVIHRTKLNRYLEFKKINVTEMCGVAVSSITAIVMAYMGGGVWSIAVMPPISAAITIPIFWSIINYKPQLEFSIELLKEIIGPGLYDTFQNVGITITKNIDYLFIGRLLGEQILGLYTLAFILTDTFRSKLMTILSKALFPIYGRMQDDKAKIKKYYLEVIKYNTILVAGVMFILGAYAEPIIEMLVGDEWVGASFPLQALAVASIIHSIGGTSTSVLKGLGYFNINFHITIFKTILITIPVLFIGIVTYGINGAAIAVIIHKLAGRLISQHYMKKYISVSEFDILKSIKPALFGMLSSVPCIAVFYYFDLKAFSLATILIVAFTSIMYIVVVYLSDKKNIDNLFVKLKNYNEYKKY